MLNDCDFVYILVAKKEHVIRCFIEFLHLTCGATKESIGEIIYSSEMALNAIVDLNEAFGEVKEILKK